MKYFSLILISIALFVVSCNQFSSEGTDALIAKYGDKYLTIDDINTEQFKGLDSKDSIAKLKEIKRQWVYNQVIINKSEKKLPAANKNIKLDLLQYKTDLLKYKYEQYYLSKKINTHVTNSEVKDFYSKNKKTLIASEAIVKAVYIEFPNTIKDSYKIKQWLVSTKEKDQEKLKNYCYQNAKVFDDFDENWIKLNSLKLLTKDKALNESRIILNKVIEYKNDSSIYYILINKLVKKEQTMPLEYAKDEVVRIIINKRKNQLLEDFDLETNQTVDALINKK